MHSKGDTIEIEISDGKINNKFKAKVIDIHYSKKTKKPIHYSLEDMNGNKIIKSVQ